MNHIKPRLLFLGLVIVSIVLVYYNWQQLFASHKYSMKVAAFAPLCGVGGLFLMAFPTMAGKPHTVKETTSVALVFVIGLIAGLVNWYLMDPRFFKH